MCVLFCGGFSMQAPTCINSHHLEEITYLGTSHYVFLTQGRTYHEHIKVKHT